MPTSIKAFVIWSVALAAVGLAVACGGEVERYGGLSENEAAELRVVLDPWLSDYLAAGFADVDRDFAYCRAPDEPVPFNPPSPDASGHARARIPCDEAAVRVEEVAETYRTLYAGLESMDVPDADAATDVHAELVEIYRLRGGLFDQIVAALAAGDDAKLAELRVPYGEMTVEESRAVGIITAIAGPSESEPEPDETETGG